jgi:hypothetical protein
VHVGDEEQQRSELGVLRDAELARLLDGVDSVSACVGQADDLGLRRLRLQQERGEVAGVQRMLDAARDLASLRDDDRAGVPLQRLAERVVGGEEEPTVAPP